MRMTQLAFIDYRNYPGGPGVFVELDDSFRVNVLGDAAYAVNEWLVDGLLVSTSRVTPVMTGLILSLADISAVRGVVRVPISK